MTTKKQRERIEEMAAGFLRAKQYEQEGCLEQMVRIMEETDIFLDSEYEAIMAYSLALNEFPLYNLWL